MGFFDGYNVSVSGMSAQRTRINVVSANIANAKTTHTAEGGPYKKQNVVFEEVLLNEKQKHASQVDKKLNENSDLALRGVGVKSIVEDDASPVMRYEPSHPDANEEGYVAYPDINPVVEMVDLIEAMRSYEANVATFNTHKGIDTKTLDIIKV
ncbi:flagellar basal body rod protein FlgC [Halarcobacter anaerophilus]|uniref:Flagellar basal-body rod protein FlgC n=1 Tax=Halarcobacter anaerophilus TaxID=877500 RepID=A0A4Q0XYQ8_9BACT|nr:flagellar basal body rod protein FlgC [Halarcobacter anaerophilus]QDF29844.1 flagellar proximal rod protein FlgC [Halarcobacter anaerophilus]RXJ62807.1 flagellar basal body rod protein FlgC [Halarcobacter anaerophilus]